LQKDLESNPPCKPRAVHCLGRNGFDEAKCTKYVDALYECCQSFYEKKGDNATSVCCPKASLLRLKMEQRRQDTGKNSK
ncbi:DUF1903-domain-containing protein, partial [Bombardia bombarda]